jgi:hypothetical protein
VILAPLALVGLAGSALAAPQSILIDFGDAAVVTGTRTESWNDIHINNQRDPHFLVDTTGADSGLALFFDSTRYFGRAHKLGPTVGLPGSELEQLGWPDTAMSDGLYSGVLPNAPDAVFRVYGLDPAASYDFTVLCSLMGSADQIATLYTVTGANTGAAVLEGADNDTQVATVVGIRPMATAEVEFTIRAATTNTSRVRDFYVNALRIDVHAAGTQPALLSTSINRLDTSRILQNGPFSGCVDLYTNDLSTPTASLTVIDDATGQPPTWLALPASGAPGTPLQLDFDPSQVPLGIHSATVTAQASGYVDAVLPVTLLAREPGPLNLLYYGNSWSTVNGSYPDLMEAMALEVGLPRPMSVHRFALGKQMSFHANNGPQMEAVSRSLPLGEEWDWVLTLTGTYETTTAKGNYAQFEADTLSVVGNVRAHSPNARACLIQPWARGQGHNIYSGQPPTFSSPLALHQEVTAGYTQVLAALAAAFGPGSAMRGPAAEAIMLRAFDPQYYGPDLAHPGAELTLMTAMGAFTCLYGERACDMTVDYLTPGLLATELTGLGFDETDRRWMAGVADRGAEPAQRRHPGSGEDFLLETGLAGALTACPRERLQPGQRLEVRVTSPNASYDGFAATLHVDAFLIGSPPGPYPPSPELHYEPSSSWVAASTPQLDSNGLTASIVIEPWMVGRALLVQAVVQAPSANTGNVITASDGHEVRTGRMASLNAVR